MPITLTKTSTTVLNRSGRCEHAFFLFLSYIFGDLFISYEFSSMAFIMVRQFAFISSFVEKFYLENMKNLIKYDFFALR